MNYKASTILKKDNKEINRNFTYLDKILLFYFFVSITAYRLNYIISISALLFILIRVFMNVKVIKISPIFLWSVIFWGYYLISSFWSMNKEDTYDYLPAIIYQCSIFLFLPTIVDSIENIDEVLKIIFYSLVYSGLIALIKTPSADFGVSRIGDVLGMNVNIFGFRMAIGALIGVYLANKKSKPKFIFIILLLFLSIMALLSGSRKSLFTLFFGIPFIYVMNSRGTKKLFRILVIFFFIVCATYLIFMNDTLYKTIGVRIERFLRQITNKSGSIIDLSVTERRFYKEIGLSLFKENPFIGIGGNNFRTYIRNINYHHVTYSHNNYIEILCTLGIIGFIIYYYYWIRTLYKSYKIFKNPLYSKNYNTSLLLIGLLIIILILDFGTVSYIFEFNFVILALVDKYIRLIHEVNNVKRI